MGTCGSKNLPDSDEKCLTIESDSKTVIKKILQKIFDYPLPPLPPDFKPFSGTSNRQNITPLDYGGWIRNVDDAESDSMRPKSFQQVLQSTRTNSPPIEPHTDMDDQPPTPPMHVMKDEMIDSPPPQDERFRNSSQKKRKRRRK